MNKVEIDIDRIIQLLIFFKASNSIYFQKIMHDTLHYLINDENTWKEIATKANIHDD